MDYLLEIGTEEIPARLVRDLASSLRDGIHGVLEEADLAPAGAVRWFATPRRLVVIIEGLPEGQPDRTEQVLGPPAKAAFDAEGKPTRAGEGFARSKGAAGADLERVTTDKGEYAALTVETRGRPTSEVLVEAVGRALKDLYLPVSMRWGEGHGPFVRAVRWVVSLLDGEVLPLELFGVQAGRETRGHRVLGPGPHALERPADYLQVLREKGAIEPDPERRLEMIRDALGRLAGEVNGRVPEGSTGLLNELVMMGEHPVVVRGGFDEKYLDLPEEILGTSMRYHQMMFSLHGPDDRMLPHFLKVINNEDPEGVIVRGEAQVLEARLDDAVFFWRKDREQGLAEFAAELPRMVYQERLGSYSDKVARMRGMAESLAGAWDPGWEGAAEMLDRAVDICKADLCTLTVGEFPELQGVVGGLLADAEGMPGEVSVAVRRQYAPHESGEAPQEARALWTSHALALLDNLDTLMGCHGVGLEASGSKDPFGLRRAAYAVVRILAEGHVGPEVEIRTLLDASRGTFKGVEGYQGDEASLRSLRLLQGRLRYRLQEEMGFPYDEVNAVFGSLWERPADALARLRAVNGLRKAGKLGGLSGPLKRTRNILNKAGLEEHPEVREDLFGEEAEREMFSRWRQIEEEVGPLLEAGRYPEALERMATLRPAVDRFFDEVLVMAEDEAVRANRLALLERIRTLFLKVADLGEIVEGAAESTDTK